jgi:hypothetical protein
VEQPGSSRAFWVGVIAALFAVFAGVGWWTRGAGAARSDAPNPRLALAAAKGVNVVVEVRNGTGRIGLARQVTRLLRERGVDVLYFGSGPATDSTRILVRRGDAARGEDVARVLGAGSVRVAPDSLLRVDVTILLGSDYRLPKVEAPL